MLNRFQEWFVTDVSWNPTTNLAIRVEDGSNKRHVQITFHSVCFLRVLSANVSEITRDNEIWKFEEIGNSPLLREVVKKDGVYRLRQSFMGEEQLQRTFEPNQLKHVLLISDYIDVELLCTSYDAEENIAD